MKPDDFIGALAGPAWDCMKATGIPASFTVAEAALESGWGAHAPGNNLFGVKATPDWKGAVTTLETSEFIGGRVVLEKATFRAYPDWLSSVLDHAGFLTGNERYSACFDCKDGPGFAQAVAAAGYATDPQYAEKIIAIIKAHNLGELDRGRD